MSVGDPRGPFLYDLPPVVSWNFCRVMDALSDLEWTRFASEVLDDQTTVRLAQRKERRTDYVMNQWEIRKGRVSDLIDLLERLQLLRPRDVILDWVSSLKPSSLPAPPPPPDTARSRPLPVSPSQFDPPPKPLNPLPKSQTASLSTRVDDREGRQLPAPAPAPSSLQSECHSPTQPPVVDAGFSGGVMCWSYEEVHAGTQGFSPSLQVGEGGFGVVYKATMRKTDFAVKRLKQDCLLDWALLRESFQTEVDKLSKFRHPNIVDLLGVSEGPGSVCLIYNYMENRSLEDQLQKECAVLSWSQRVSVVKGASAALQFLHCPPDRHTPLIHGDVKSSNILLDCHMMARLADFGLAQFASHKPPEHTASQTSTIGQTATIRGTLAYLPDEYVRNGKLGTAVDVYSFGVVLLEVLTGRRALEKDKKSGERYLKDLVGEVEDSPAGSSVSWRRQLDHRLITGGATEPVGSMVMADLACSCLDRNRKRRPAMMKVFDKLQDIHNIISRTSSSSSLQGPSQPFPRPTPPLESSVGSLSQELSKLGPLEDTYQASQLSSSSSSSSSFCSLTSQLLDSSSSLSSASSSSLSPSSFAGPCETDESRGYSQYNLGSQLRGNRTSTRSLSPSTRNQSHNQPGPKDSQLNQPSIPTEDQYSFPPQPNHTLGRPWAQTLTGTPAGPDTRGQNITEATAGVCIVPESLSPVRSLQSFPGPSVHINPSKQHLLQKKTLYEEGRIQTPELLSSDDLYEERTSVDLRGPEESDELDYLPAQHR